MQCTARDGVSSSVPESGKQLKTAIRKINRILLFANTKKMCEMDSIMRSKPRDALDKHFIGCHLEFLLFADNSRKFKNDFQIHNE